ncbi:MAG TPA: glycerophosphodiester phosphodiesterase [Microlunatus sp.]|nr:glycerophosphodiester phosphodiesterase [Microlunatus sp.]
MASRTASPPASRRGRPQVTLAHRGWSGREPENTLRALAAAVPYADYCEIDVRATRDGRLILMHDRTLRRTTDVAEVFVDRADEPAESFSLDELRQLDAGRWYDPATPASVPTLREALDLLTGHDRGALLELKTDTMALVAAELTELRERHPEAAVAAASIVPARSAELRRLLPDLAIGVLFLDEGSITGAEIDGYAEFADFLCFRNDRVSAALVDRVHRSGMKIIHNTNTRAFMAEGLRHGADGTMTDHPDRRDACDRGERESIIEAEALLGVCRGSVPPRRTDGRGLPFKLSGRAGLVADLAPGDRLELPFVADAGRSALECVLVRQPTGGVVELTSDGVPAAEPVDLAGPSPSRRTLEVAGPLSPGPHRLRFTAVTAGRLLIDCLTLRMP